MANKSISKEEQENIKELFLKFQETRDKKTRDTLVEKNLYIAEILAKKYTGRGIEYDDLYQVACIGLIYAIDRYDPSKGYEFSSYATPTIVGEIKKYFRDKGWVIRVPRRIQELNKKLPTPRFTLHKLCKNLQQLKTSQIICRYQTKKCWKCWKERRSTLHNHWINRSINQMKTGKLILAI